MASRKSENVTGKHLEQKAQKEAGTCDAEHWWGPRSWHFFR